VKRRPSLEQTLLSYRLPPTIAERVTGLPEPDQVALARLIEEIGQPGLDRLLNALAPIAPGGRRAGYAELEPLLRQMAAEMMAQNPHLHAIGANWRKGANTAAKTVAKSPAGEEFRKACGIELDSLRTRLVRAWKEHGRRLLQEHVVAAQDTTWFVKACQELRREGSEWTVLMDKFSGLNAVEDKFCPRYIRSKCDKWAAVPNKGRHPHDTDSH
jgi:hypothetical protein